MLLYPGSQRCYPCASVRQIADNIGSGASQINQRAMSKGCFNSQMKQLWWRFSENDHMPTLGDLNAINRQITTVSFFMDHILQGSIDPARFLFAGKARCPTIRRFYCIQ